jgi:uncharacterized membrane protein
MALDRNDKMSVSALAACTMLTAAVYTQLPLYMPVHFDIHGEPDGWAPRALGAWLMPAIGVFTWVVGKLSPRLVPERARDRLKGSPLTAFGFVMSMFFSLLQCVMLHAATHPDVSVARAVSFLIGGMIIAIGQMMPRVRRNPIFGIRTTWTMSSDENWLRTHRVAAYALTIGGAIALLGAIFAGDKSLFIAIPAVLLSSLWPVIYSWRLARTLPPDRL